MIVSVVTDGSVARPGSKRLYARTRVTWLLAVLFTGCAGSSQVKTEYDRSVDFERYRAFAWSPGFEDAHALALDEQIKSAVNNELLSRGFRHSRNPDFLIRYRVEKGEPSTEVLRLDLIDAGSQRVIWRGSGAVIVSDETSARLRKHGIAAILEGFPPR